MAIRLLFGVVILLIFVISVVKATSCGYYCSGTKLYEVTCYGSGDDCTCNSRLETDCSRKASTDTDGGDRPFTAGQVLDYYDCSVSGSEMCRNCAGRPTTTYSMGGCDFRTYRDACVSSYKLKEYYPSGSSYGYKYYNCNDYDGFYSGSYRDYYCSNDRCTYTVVCSNECTAGETRCNDGNVQECRTDGDSDPCTEWVDVNSCNDYDGNYCSGNALEQRDYYCTGGACDYNVISDANCDVNDYVGVDAVADTCIWENWSCSPSGCYRDSNGSSSCDAYDSLSDTLIHDCEVTDSSCTVGCSGSGCCDCEDHRCDSSHLCDTHNFEGTEYTCIYDGGFHWSTSVPDENCSDGIDNDCDGKTDLDDSDCSSYRPNFLISSVVPVKDHHLVGHHYAYKVTVENDGATGSDTNVALLVNGSEVDRKECYVPAGGTCMVTLHWTPTHVGTDLNYVADPDDTVAETDETDNYYYYETSSCDPLYSYDADEDGNDEYWVDCDGDGNVDSYYDEDDGISTDTDNQDYDGDPTIEYGTDTDGDGTNEGYYDPDTNTFVRFTGKVFVAKVPATGELTFIALSTAGLLVFFVYLLAT